MTFAEELDALERWVRAYLPAAAATLEPGIARAALERTVAGAFELPVELVTLWAWCGGQRREVPAKPKAKPTPRPVIAADYTIYELTPPADVVALKARLDAKLAAGKFDTKTFTTKYAWDRRWIPFAHAGTHDLVIDGAGYFGGVVGQVIRFDARGNERYLVAPSLEALIRHHLRMVAAGGVVVRAGKPAIVSRSWDRDPDHPGYPIRKNVERTPRPVATQGTPTALLQVLKQRMSASEVDASLATGARLDVTDANGCAPLHLAAQCSTTGPAEVMLRAGAVVDARDAAGNTPLAFAVELSKERDAVDMVRVLVRAGADPDLPNTEGTTPRQRAERRFSPTTRDPVLAALAEQTA